MWGDIDGYDTCYKMLAIGCSHTVGGNTDTIDVEADTCLLRS